MTRLTFACELDTPELLELFSDPTVIENLRTLNATVSLAIRDRSKERAQIIRSLTAAGIPIVAWLVVPEEDGYWFHVGNVHAAKKAYADFQHWTSVEKLVWAGIGVDMEPDIRDVRLVLGHGLRPLVSRLLRRLVQRRKFCDSQIAYFDLIAQMRADGNHVESYLFPFIVDERRSGSTLLQRLMGVVDVPADDEILMLYTSYARRYGSALVAVYGCDALSIGVGSTGGDISLPGQDRFEPLNWEELQEDLRAAKQFADHIFIFSLEGCVSQGFLSRLIDFDWSASPEVLSVQGKRARRLRRWVGWFLKLAKYAWLLLGLLIAVVLAIIGMTIYR